MGIDLKDYAEKVAAVTFPTQLLGTGLAGGFDYLGSRQDRKAAERANEANINMAREQMALQREFAQMGIQWKVEDARKAGIHPLAALGAQGASFSPVSVGQEPISRGGEYRSLGQMGQNLTRAAMAAQTMDQRVFTALQAKSLDLDNQMKQVELDRMRQMGPSMPSASSDPNLVGDIAKANGVDPRVIDLPAVRTMSDPRSPHREAGAIPDIKIVRTKKGYAVVQAKDVKQSIEDSPMEWQWLARNVLRLYDTPGGYKAIMNPFTGELMVIPFTKRKRKVSDF